MYICMPYSFWMSVLYLEVQMLHENVFGHSRVTARPTDFLFQNWPISVSRFA